MQGGNRVGVAALCRIIACILYNVKLTKVRLDHGPSACVAHAAWRSEALPVPPAEVAGEDWDAVLEFLREVSACKTFFEVPTVETRSAVVCRLFYISPLPVQAARNKHERLMSAAPAATLDCSALWDHRLVLSAISNAAAKYAGSPL